MDHTNAFSSLSGMGGTYEEPAATGGTQSTPPEEPATPVVPELKDEEEVPTPVPPPTDTTPDTAPAPPVQQELKDDEEVPVTPEHTPVETPTPAVQEAEILEETVERVHKNTVVAISYQLRVTDAYGALIDKSEGADLFTFLVGGGQMLPKFEEHLMGKQVGEEFSFVIDHKDGYGETQEDALMEVAKREFEVNGVLAETILKEDAYVSMKDQDGNPLIARIDGVGEETVTIDLNHPLAGEDLYFKGNIVSIRNATSHEMALKQVLA